MVQFEEYKVCLNCFELFFKFLIQFNNFKNQLERKQVRQQFGLRPRVAAKTPTKK